MTKDAAIDEAMELVRVIVTALVDYPEDVLIKVIPDGDSQMIYVGVAQPDCGKVIGKMGRTAKSIRTILNGFIKPHGIHLGLNIVDVNAAGITNVTSVAESRGL